MKQKTYLIGQYLVGINLGGHDCENWKRVKNSKTENSGFDWSLFSTAIFSPISSINYGLDHIIALSITSLTVGEEGGDLWSYWSQRTYLHSAQTIDTSCRLNIPYLSVKQSVKICWYNWFGAVPMEPMRVHRWECIVIKGHGQLCSPLSFKFNSTSFRYFEECVGTRILKYWPPDSVNKWSQWNESVTFQSCDLTTWYY